MLSDSRPWERYKAAVTPSRQAAARRYANRDATDSTPKTAPTRRPTPIPAARKPTTARKSRSACCTLSILELGPIMMARDAGGPVADTVLGALVVALALVLTWVAARPAATSRDEDDPSQTPRSLLFFIRSTPAMRRGDRSKQERSPPQPLRTHHAHLHHRSCEREKGQPQLPRWRST